MPPKPHADPWHADALRDRLHKRGFTHLRVRKRGAALTIESGPDDNPWAHARLKRDTVHLWTLQMAGRGGRWEITPFRGTMDELVEILTDSFPWTIAHIEGGTR